MNRANHSASVVLVLVAVLGSVASAQPGADPPPAPPPIGSAGSADPGSAGPSADPAAGSGAPAAGSGSAGSATDPGSAAGSGSAGSAAGSAAGSGSAGSAAGSAAGSGSGTGPRIIQLPTDANAPQVSAAASPTVVRLGGKFTLFITATFGEGVEVNLREPIELGAGLEVTRKLSEDRPAGDGRKTREWQLEVIAWELGDLVMPGVAVTYTAFGRADQVLTNRVNLRIEGVLGDVVDDPKTMRGDAAPNELYARDWFWLYVGLAGILCFGSIITVYVLWRNSRRKRMVLVGGVVAVPRKFDTASSRALERLLAIEASGVLDRDDDRKQGYADMVEVIREYLGSRYRVATFDLTSSELLKRLDKVAPVEERAMIESWLEACDIVKYGGLKATTAVAKVTLDDARALVVTTTQLQQAAGRSPRTTAAAEPAPTEPSPSGPGEPSKRRDDQEAA